MTVAPDDRAGVAAASSTPGSRTPDDLAGVAAGPPAPGSRRPDDRSGVAAAPPGSRTADDLAGVAAGPPAPGSRTLAQILARAERQERLSADPWLELVPAPSPGRAAVVSFPGYVVVAADVDRAWVDSWMGDGDFGRPTGPPFLGALEERLRVEAGNLDALLLGTPLPGDPPIELTRLEHSRHARVVRAHRYRTDVRAWAGAHGILVIGRGLGGRWEAAFEVDEDARGRGYGRALATAARHLVPDGRPIWAQCAPGNASSLRALLAAGYLPIGSEVLLIPA